MVMHFTTAKQRENKKLIRWHKKLLDSNKKQSEKMAEVTDGAKKDC